MKRACDVDESIAATATVARALMWQCLTVKTEFKDRLSVKLQDRKIIYLDAQYIAPQSDGRAISND
jgi:hypothetical protein